MEEVAVWMRFGSLFSGIGGLDLGLERAGMECAWQVEIDEWCRRILERHWPSVPRWADIKEFPPIPDTEGAGLLRTQQPQDHRASGAWREGPDTHTIHQGWAVDLIVGGFPCQPVSKAGQQRAQGDERWLWPEFARVLGLLRPRYVLVENVPGLLTVNRGGAFGDVLGDLAALGYDAEWDCIPAAAVGAPHLRDRVFLLAHANGSGRVHGQAGEQPAERGQQAFGEPESSGSHVEDTTSEGRDAWVQGPGDSQEGGSFSWPERSDWWATEPNVGRVAHGIPSRVDRLKGLGNAVVPQVAEYVGRRLMEGAA